MAEKNDTDRARALRAHMETVPPGRRAVAAEAALAALADAEAAVHAAGYDRMCLDATFEQAYAIRDEALKASSRHTRDLEG